MDWYWWLLIFFGGICILNWICQENPAFRQVFCCIIAVVYPILMFIFPEQDVAILIIGALALGFYKYLFGMAEIMEEEGPPDIFIIFWSLSDTEEGVVMIIFSLISILLFAGVAIIPFAMLLDVSMVLACIWLFVPAIYCIITTVIYFREQY